MGLTRGEFWAALGLMKVVEPLTEYAVEMTELAIWKGDEESSPHGQPWHTSFHASQFPGDDPYACGRAALYGMMNVPSPEPTSRWLRGLGEAGKAIEDFLVRRWGTVGALLSADADADEQTGFVDPETWFTGNCDAIVIPFGWNRGHVVDVKGKFVDVVKDMQHFMRGPDDKHVRQIKAYIGEAHDTFHLRYPEVCVCESTWAVASNIVGGVCPIHGGDACLKMIKMQPVVDGSLYYVARDDWNVTHEFFFGYDKNFTEEGKRRLVEWKEHFKEGTLPPRPDGWMWSKEPYPCRFCPYKKHACKPDDKEMVERLEDSHAIEYAQSIWPDYDYEATRATVLDRWIQDGRNAPKEE
jgi:hypothetical protein